MSKLIDFLQEKGALGKPNAIPRARLAVALGVTPRGLRALAEEARNAGEFVCYSTTGSGGVFLAATDEERIEIVGQIRSTCLKRLRQYSALKRKFQDRYQRRLFPETPDEVFSRGYER